MAADMRVRLRVSRWRLVVARAVLWGLCIVACVVPVSVDEDWWTDCLAGFICRGVRVEIVDG